MSYCSSEQVLLRAPAVRVSPRAAECVSAGLANAQARIDAKLAGKFAVPFASPVPNLILDVAIDLAAAHAIKSAFSGAQNSEQLMFAENLKAGAMETLQEIFDGDLRMEAAANSVVLPENAAPMVMTSRGNGLEGFDLLGYCGPKSPREDCRRFPGGLGGCR